MKASELKELAYKSISKEISELETLMEKESKKGMLKMEVPSLSDAAKQYLLDNGFEVKLFISAGELEIKKNKFTVHWSK